MDYLRLMRVQDWLKSCFVLIGCIYSRQWNDYWLLSLGAAVAFSFIASSVYVYNDIKDIAFDKAHPIKQFRPLAQGVIPLSHAYFLLVGLLLLGLILGGLISNTLLLILVIYLSINMAYNHGLKWIAYVDLVCIASGFLLRILAGTIGIEIALSHWLLLCGTLLSLYIALCKRKLEMRLVSSYESRTVLGHYHLPTVNFLMIAIGLGCLVSYSIYSYKIGYQQQHYTLVLSIPFAFIGLYRLWTMSLDEINTDDPIQLMLHDTLSWVNVLVFILLTLYSLST